MIFGNCPYCDHPWTTAVPDDVGLPKMVRTLPCENCGMWWWEKLSRIDPECFKQDEVEFDEETKTVTIKRAND